MIETPELCYISVKKKLIKRKMKLKVKHQLAGLRLITRNKKNYNSLQYATITIKHHQSTTICYNLTKVMIETPELYYRCKKK